MLLKELLTDIDHTLLRGSDDADITGLSIDSRKAEKMHLFIAVKGRNVDGHDFILKAIENGAESILIDRDRVKSVELDLKNHNVNLISVDDTRDILSRISNTFYGNPAEKFNLIGVTGTNGKTSVTVILENVLRLLGHKNGLIGTIANYCGGEELDIDKTTPTTPDCIELAEIMSAMAKHNVDNVIMEASSMGLKTKRVKDLTFDVGVFTNISPEHLDDHKTMEDYKASKLLLFKQSKKTVVNMDDDFAQDIVDVSGPCLKYGFRKKGPCDLVAESISFTGGGVSFRMVYGAEQIPVHLNIPSEFAIYNMLAVAGTCIQMGIPFKALEGPVNEDVAVPGRYDIVQTEEGFTGIIDYAHTEVALDNLLQAVKSNPAYNRVISVFGCGGDRDPSKRAPMAKVSGENADYTIITSDNPRTEDPKKIVDMVETGIKDTGADYEVIIDRKSAIQKAVEMAEEGDAIVIAGKGHETYQILNEGTIDFDDKEIFKTMTGGQND